MEFFLKKKNKIGEHFFLEKQISFIKKQFKKQIWKKQDELWANAHLWYPRIYVQCV